MKLYLENVRLATFGGLWKATAFEEGQTEKFGGDFIFEEGSKVYAYKIVDDPSKPGAKKAVREAKPMDPDSVKAIKQAFIAVANDTWKGKGLEKLKALDKNQKSLRDGNTKLTVTGEQYEGYADRFYLSAKNAKRPVVVDRDGVTPLTEADGRPYSGSYVNATVDVYGMVPKGKKNVQGVFASLLAVQFLRDGDAFSGGAVGSANDFEPIGDAGTDAADVGADDDIPF